MSYSKGNSASHHSTHNIHENQRKCLAITTDTEFKCSHFIQIVLKIQLFFISRVPQRETSNLKFPRVYCNTYLKLFPNTKTYNAFDCFEIFLFI